MSGMKCPRFVSRPWFMKICLLALFFIYMGGHQFIWQTHKSMNYVNRQDYSADQLQLNQIYSNYLESTLDLAKKKVAAGDVYTPADYFTDMKLAYQKKIEIGLKLPGPDFFIFPQLNELTKNYLKNLSRKKLKAEMIKAEGYAEDYKEFIDPGRVPREKTFNELKSLGWQKIFIWLLFVYLKVMPFAFILFLIWATEIWEDEKLHFPKPFRFLLLLIFYPIIIVWVLIKNLKREARDYLAEAEYRRTKQNLFSCLSEQEIQKIKDFKASTLSISIWWKQLTDLGLKPKHCLASALIVTLLINFFPILSQAEKKGRNACLSEITSGQTNQHLARMSIDNDHGNSGWDDWPDKPPICFEMNDLSPIIIIWILQIRKKYFRFKKVCRQIDHVPLYSVVQCEI